MGRGSGSIVIGLSLVALASIGSLIDYLAGGIIMPREREVAPALAGLGAVFIFLLLLLLGSGKKKVVQIGV